MITYVKRKHLDVKKYDICIDNSKESRVYAYSWFLDIVADNWDVLVLNDYEAVMPIPWRRKFGIKYSYVPLWVLELGVFSTGNEFNIDDFIIVIKQKFKYAEYYFNTDNFSNQKDDLFLNIRNVQVLDLSDSYSDIHKKYRSDRKKDLKIAKKFYLNELWNDNPKRLIDIFKNNIGKRVKTITKKDYAKLEHLIDVCIRNNKGQILSIYDRADYLVASAFILKHKTTVTILLSSTDFDNRQKGGNTFLIDTAIAKFINDFEVFNFGGSSISSIANYFLSFGAKTKEYHHIKINKLPKFLRLLKK